MQLGATFHLTPATLLMSQRLRERSVKATKETLDQFYLKQSTNNSMSANEAQFRIQKLQWVALFLLVLLFTKVLLSILYEYRWYFPANFQSAIFLTGRQETFVGGYRAAFYAHIVSGPITVLMAVLLMFSGGRSRYRKLHRWLGRAVVTLAVVVVAPSGMVMSTQSFTGPIAGWGFASLALATGVSGVAAGYYARARHFGHHQIWATRLFLLLCSPLLLRLSQGAAVVSQVESSLTYRLAAWLSWLVPLLGYEIWRQYRATFRSHGALDQHSFRN